MNVQIRLVGKKQVGSQDIIYLKADINYTEVHLKNGKKLIVSKTLKQMEQQFKTYDFFRTHKSYMVNMDHVLSIRINDGVKVQMTNNQEAEISRRRKDAFLDAMRGKI